MNTPTLLSSSLQHLYGKSWSNALGIVDEAGAVSCYLAEPSGRTLFLVRRASTPPLTLDSQWESRIG